MPRNCGQAALQKVQTGGGENRVDFARQGEETAGVLENLRTPPDDEPGERKFLLRG